MLRRSSGVALGKKPNKKPRKVLPCGAFLRLSCYGFDSYLRSFYER
jgi:hypothetical protein